MEREFADFPFVLRAPLPELDPHRSAMIEEVLAAHRVWTPPKHEHNFLLPARDSGFARLYDRFLDACRAEFEPFTLHPESNRRSWAYVQSSERSSPIWHDHLQTATLNGVFYLAVPDPAAQLLVRHLGRTRAVSPRVGWLYVFPGWLEHMPATQQSAEPRISVNIELISREVPIHRVDGVRW